MATYGVNYNTILDDVKTLIATITDFKRVERDQAEDFWNYSHMPLCDIRLKGGEPEAKVGQTYYTSLHVMFEVAAHDLSSQEVATTIALGLLRQVQEKFVQNPHFSANVDGVLLGPFDVMSAKDPKIGSFIASVVGEVTINVYSQ